MAEETGSSYGASEIESVAQKLTTFGQSLSASEQSILVNLLQRAAASSEEVDTSGFLLTTPVNFNVPLPVLGLALGRQEPGEGRVTLPAFLARPQEFCA